MRGSFGVAALLLVLGAGPAEAKPDVDVGRIGQIEPRRPGEPEPGAAKRYAEARRRLARGQPAKALELLKAPSFLFEDRVHLLKGDAALALKNPKGAKQSYVRAFETAQLPSIQVAAARGLLAVYAEERATADELALTDGLLREREAAKVREALLLRRAQLLATLGRSREAADQAIAILDEFPGRRVAQDADAFLARLAKRGVKIPPQSLKLELGRVERLVRRGAFDDAHRLLAELEKTSPGQEVAVKHLLAELYRREKKHEDEERVLTELADRELDKSVGPAVLDRLARIRMRRDDNEGAAKGFEELARRYPDSREATEALFLGAWLPYNEGRYEEAADRFLALAERYPSWSRRSEALWFAGWSSYLGGAEDRSRRAFDQLLEDHPASEMGRFARYWQGRASERAGANDRAVLAYRQILKAAPLSYHAEWASFRLAGLGEKIVLTAPKVEAGAKVAEVIELLGASRPVHVDRAIALYAEGLERDAVDELHFAARWLTQNKDLRGRVMVAELLNALGAHHEAFRIASAAIDPGGSDVIAGKPFAWRAWQLAYPLAFWKDVEAAAKTHGVDPFFVLAIMRTETHFRPTARSPVGARGLMQLMPKTAERIGIVAEGGRAHAARYTEPASNIWLGAWYLARLVERYQNNLALAAAAYNGGPSSVDRWLAAHQDKELDAFVETISFRETRRYVRSVMEAYQIYRRIHGDGPVDLGPLLRLPPGPEGAISF